MGLFNKLFYEPDNLNKVSAAERKSYDTKNLRTFYSLLGSAIVVLVLQIPKIIEYHDHQKMSAGVQDIPAGMIDSDIMKGYERPEISSKQQMTNDDLQIFNNSDISTEILQYIRDVSGQTSYKFYGARMNDIKDGYILEFEIDSKKYSSKKEQVNDTPAFSYQPIVNLVARKLGPVSRIKLHPHKISDTQATLNLTIEVQKRTTKAINNSLTSI